MGMVRVLGVYCLPADAKFFATLVALGELLVHLGFQVYYEKRDINGDARQMSFIDHDLMLGGKGDDEGCKPTKFQTSWQTVCP